MVNPLDYIVVLLASSNTLARCSYLHANVKPASDQLIKKFYTKTYSLLDYS